MQRNIITTTDGSHSIFIPELNEHYHSIHGAVQESLHVFIDAGLREVAKNRSSIHIFEVGFGTGLNAFLTYLEAEKNNLKINYTSVEAFPVEKAISEQLNYPETLKTERTVFDQLHAAPWETTINTSGNFSLRKVKSTLQEIDLSSEQFDLVYFDAFGPPVQPEMWTDAIFQKLAAAMSDGAVLVTYCSKGEVQRSMKRAGLIVEKIPGPPGKREMVRATKPA